MVELASNAEMTYGFEETPLSKSFTSKSKYEDVGTIARIGSAEMSQCAAFELFNQENMMNFHRLAGHIYSQADLRKLALEKRPAFEWNLYLPIILSILGNFQDSIPGVDFFGMGSKGEKAADLQKKLCDYFLYQANDIEYELAKAFLFSVVARIGWLKCNWSFDKDPKGMVQVEWYDSFRLKFDRNWRRRDTRDMRYISDSGFYDVSELINNYAKNNVELREEIYDKALLIVGESAMNKGRMKRMLMTWAERFLTDTDFTYQGAKHGYDTFNDNAQTYNYNGTWYNSDGRFKVVDWYEKRQQPCMEITDLATGQSELITDQVKKEKPDPWDESSWYDNEKLQRIRDTYKAPRIKETWTEVIWQTSVVPALNLKLFDEPMKVQCGLFKFVPVLCYDFHPDIMETKSVIDTIVDPVSSYNMRRNTILTYVMKMSSGGWLAEQSAVNGREDEILSNEIGGLKIVNDGALSGKKMIKDEPATLPSGLTEESEIEINDLEKISGSPPAVRGLRQSPNESGKLNGQRIQQASVMQEWITNNAQSSLILIATLNFNIAKRYLRMPRALMIINDSDEKEELQLNVSIMGEMFNDVSYGELLIRISKNPAGRGAIAAEFQKVMAANEWLAQTFGAQYVDPKIALKLSGLTVRYEMISHIKQVEQMAAQQAQQQQQIQAGQMQQAQEDDDVKRKVLINHAKLDLVKSLNELHAGTLKNRELSDKLVSNHIMNQLFQQSTNGAQQ
jgi:hypothetical protein